MKIGPWFIAVALLFGCHGRNPPVLPVQPVRALSIPAIQESADPSLLGYAKIREPRKVIAEVGEAEVRRVLKAPAMDINFLRPGAPVTFVLWGPDGFNFDKVPLAVFLPLKSLPPAMDQEDREGGIRRLQDFTLAAISPAARARLDGASSLLPLAREPGPWDAQVTVSLAAITRTYGTQIHAGLGALQGILAAQKRKPGDPDPQALGAMLGKFLGRLEEMESYTMGLDLLQDEVELDTLLKDKQGGPGGPVAAPDLMPFLPAADIRVQWNVRDLASKIGTYLDWYTPLLESTSPGLAGPLRSLMTDFGKLGEMQIGTALSLDGNAGMRGASLVLTRDPEGYLALLRRGVEMFNQPGVKGAYAKLGFDLSMTLTQKVRKVHGRPVDRYRFSMVARKDLTPEQQRAQAAFNKMPFLQKLMNLNYEVMSMGNYLLFSFNDSLEGLADRLLSGHGDRPLRAASVFPAGGTLYADIDAASLLRFFRQVMPDQAAAKVPDAGGMASTVTLASYDAGIVGYHRLRVPRPLLGLLFRAAK